MLTAVYVFTPLTHIASECILHRKPQRSIATSYIHAPAALDFNTLFAFLFTYVHVWVLQLMLHSLACFSWLCPLVSPCPTVPFQKWCNQYSFVRLFPFFGSCFGRSKMLRLAPSNDVHGQPRHEKTVMARCLSVGLVFFFPHARELHMHMNVIKCLRPYIRRMVHELSC